MAIAPEHVQNVCRIAQGARTCSFLLTGGNGFVCGKGTSMENTIRAKRDQGAMNAMGDNCSGPPDFIPTGTEPEFH